MSLYEIIGEILRFGLWIGSAIVMFGLICAILDVRGYFDEQVQIKIEPAPPDAKKLPAFTETVKFEILE